MSSTTFAPTSPITLIRNTPATEPAVAAIQSGACNNRTAADALYAILDQNWSPAEYDMQQLGFSTAQINGVVQDFKDNTNTGLMDSDLAGILNAGGDTNQWADAYKLQPLIEQNYSDLNQYMPRDGTYNVDTNIALKEGQTATQNSAMSDVDSDPDLTETTLP